jgi:GTP-binding protein
LKVLQATRKELAPWADQVSVQLFSSLKKTGGEEAEKVIGRWLELAEDTEEKRNAPG